MQSTSDPAQVEQQAGSPAVPRRRWWRLALWIVGGVALVIALYAALGFWAAPKLIRSQVISQAAERYHRKAELGEVRFNPFTLRLEAQNFSLPDADGKPMIGFDRLTVRVAPASLWRGVDFTEIGLDAPRVRVVIRPNGRLNLLDLVPPSSGKPPANAKPPKILVDHLEIRGGRTEFTDLARTTPFTKALAPVSFKLHDFSTVKAGAGFSLKAVTERGERLAWSGVFGTAPLSSQGRFALAQVKAAPLSELAQDVLPFDVTAGDIDLSGAYRFALNGDRLALGVDLDDLKLTSAGLRARGADRDWITLPAAEVSKVHVDVPARAVSVGRIELTNPAVTAWTEHNGLNLLRYAPPRAPETAVQKPAASAAWTVALPDLRLHGGRLAFEDRTAIRPVQVAATPIEIAVTGFALPITGPVQVEASTAIEGGGRLSAKGAVTLDKLSADLKVEAADLGLPRLQPYIDHAANLKLLSGRLSGQGRLTYAADGATRFDGAIQSYDLHTIDKVLSQDFINWRALRFNGVSVQTRPLAVKVREVTAQQPYARVLIGPNYVMNIKTVLSPEGAVAPAVAPNSATPDSTTAVSDATVSASPAAAAPPPATPQKPGLPIEIGVVRIADGRMDFSDLSIQPHFAAGIQSLAGTVKGLSGRQDARAVVDLAGQVERYAPVKIEGQVNYFAARSYTDVRMNFQNMELTTFSPYSGKFAGYRIDKGKLNVDLHYNIDDQKLVASHHVVINQLQLGDKVDSANAVKLPVKLIVALLKDRHGVIDLPIEIEGTLNDPKFKIWPVIWHVVHNLMVKVATAPFAALGRLVGGGEELSYVDFQPGAPGLDEADRQKLAGLVKALIERPAVNLEIPMTVDPQVDRPALAAARFDAEIAAAAAQKPPARKGRAAKASAARRAMLESLYLKQFAAKPAIPKPQAAKDGAKTDPDEAAAAWLEARLREHIVVTDQDLQQLGKGRAEAVQAALLDGGQINPTRIFVVTAPPADAPAVRMTLSLR